MKRVFFIVLALMIFGGGCDSLSNDYIDNLLGVNGISPKRICENNPTVFKEGRFVKVYTFSEADFEKVITKIRIDGNSIPDRGILKYGNSQQIINWRSTPPTKEDLDKMNILDDIKDQNFGCFSSIDVLNLLQGKENFYTFLDDHVRGYKLFIIEYSSKKLYLLTSYQN